MSTIVVQQQGQQEQPQPPPPQQQPPPPAGPPPAYPGAVPPPPQAVYAQPPPPPGYQPYPGQTYGQQPYGQQQQQSTVIVNQPRSMNRLSYGRSPVSQDCQYCSKSITTSTSRKCGASVWIVVGIICFIGLWIPLLWLGCCLIPFCIPSLYDVEHTCPNCHRVLGKTSSMGGL